LSKKRERALKENEDIRSKLVSLIKGLEEFESSIDISYNEEEVIKMAKALKASQLLLQQKSFDVQKSEERISELNIRLELEHVRRMRAQAEIGDIEKAQISIQNDLLSKNMFVTKSEENEELKLDCDNKISKYTLEIQILESKLEKILETQSLIKEMEILKLIIAELEKHIFSTEVQISDDDSASIEMTQNGMQIYIDEVL
jgi:hypothetical protein